MKVSRTGAQIAPHKLFLLCLPRPVPLAGMSQRRGRYRAGRTGGHSGRLQDPASHLRRLGVCLDEASSPKLRAWSRNLLRTFQHVVPRDDLLHKVPDEREQRTGQGDAGGGTAKVARDDQSAVSKVGTAENRQNGPPSRAGRLAVVAHSLCDTRAMADREGIAVVPGIWESRFDAADVLPRRFDGRRVSQAACRGRVEHSIRQLRASVQIETGDDAKMYR
jgi:hypothetical protein